MSFVKIDGFDFKVFVPENSLAPKKHPCRDCYYCRFCNDERCNICLKKKCCENFTSNTKKSDDEDR